MTRSLSGIFAAVLGILVLGGCQTTVKTPGAKIKTESVEIEVGGSRPPGPGAFCPPGQAKKNAC